MNSDVMMEIRDKGGKRVGSDRRMSPYIMYIPERRSFRERRNGVDRRNEARMRDGIERRVALARVPDEILSKFS
jgi:hypothetical protein